MWLTFDEIDSDILIDCRNLNNNSEIMPTYRLAKKLNVIKKLVFHIDNLFFGFYFLKNLSYFTKNSIIYTDNNIYYLSKQELNNSIEIKNIVLGNISNNMKLDWVIRDFTKIQNGLGAIKFDEGYIIVKK